MTKAFNLAVGPLGAERDRDGWRVRATRVGDELGSRMIGGSIYELLPGERSFPFHYHHGVEEWLLVIDGTPSVRTPSGTRELDPGDVVCFPPGAEGAHDVTGPGRVLILSSGGPPSISVYPESDKLGTRSGDGYDTRDFRRADAVDYWEGGGVNVANLFAVELTLDEGDPDGYHTAYARVGPLVGGSRLGLSVYELPPGQSICPYHWEAGDEEWLVVLSGRPTLRTPTAERELEPWDAVCFPAGADGAHKVTNRGGEAARVAMLSTKNDPGIAVYPDSNKVGAWPPGKLFRLDDAVDYWDGEA